MQLYDYVEGLMELNRLNLKLRTGVQFYLYLYDKDNRSISVRINSVADLRDFIVINHLGDDFEKVKLNYDKVYGDYEINYYKASMILKLMQY